MHTHAKTNDPVGCLAAPGDSLVALATPLFDGAVDIEIVARLCDRQVRRGSAALVVCGTTGEVAALSACEQARLVATAVAVAKPRSALIRQAASSSGYATLQ